jgi:hypothetical protein
VDGGICLRSNGQPAAADAPVYADGHRPGTPLNRSTRPAANSRLRPARQLAEQCRLIDHLRSAADSVYPTPARQVCPAGCGSAPAANRPPAGP